MQTKEDIIRLILNRLFMYINDLKNTNSDMIYVQQLEWKLFYDECRDFIKQFEQDLDLSKLKKEIEINTFISKGNYIPIIERDLKSIEIQMGLFNNKNNKSEKGTIMEKPIKIFISHSSKDIEYTKALVELLEGIGVEEKQIFCSSLREYGVTVGENICERLKSEFNSFDLWVFFMLSHNYYSSPISLNEMGAAWVLQKKYLSFLLPGFNFEDIEGVINSNKVGIQLESSEVKAMLNDLKDKVCETFNCTISYNKWERLRDAFIDKVKN